MTARPAAVRGRPPRQASRERGSGAVALVLAGLLFLVVASFIVDTGQAIHRRDRAADTAEQAARYAGNQISTDGLRQGVVLIDAVGCTDRVQEFVRSSGFSEQDAAASRCTDVTGNQVSVEVRLTYSPLLLSALRGRVTVWGRATAQAIQEL
ncbi:TadE/TadG family type IV pilus assembly protein [Kitasatospora sp. NPDC001540]|uniref:TadE/TadG family type IV pilus assembly protein n=1 Tax=Kitasatospora sp. NPDC001540 TaxID=3364014 RepID=UPI0036A3649C